jgi:transposase InsO family protein
MILAFLRAFFASRAALAAENMMLRQQLIVVHRSSPRPKFRRIDRILLCLLSRLWSGWRSALLIVQPDTLTRWHRQGFKLYWSWKSRKKPGRPKADLTIRDLIRRMCRENATWGVPRIQSELALLGHNVAESTVAKYMVRQPKPPSQNWRTFLANHVGQIAAIDFFTVSTITFRVMYIFLVLQHDRRRVVHFNVTTSPTARWAAQQIVEAFPFDEASRFLLRDRDSIYGYDFRDRVEHMGIEEVLSAPRSPWQNPYVERIIGSVRRECLDHVIVLNEDHLRRILASYFEYYHEARAHLSLDRNSPIPRPVCPPEQGKVVAKAYLGGLHHCYTRVA